MAELSRDPRRGEDILEQFLRLKADLRRERIVSVVGGMLSQVEGGRCLTVTHKKGRGGSINPPAWYSTYSDMTITITPGDIELGPDTVIEWGDITNASTTVTAADESPTWFIWVNVDISTDPPTAEMLNGETITALTSEQKLKIYQKRICSVTITNDEETPANDVINGIKVCQVGNITIPRAAG